MWVRCISAPWCNKPPVEGNFTSSKIKSLNSSGFNIYYFPNHPADYSGLHNVSGVDIKVFEYVFVDMDLKENKYDSKDAFISRLGELMPTRIVDSGRGVHAYWKVSDLDAKSYLALSRRLMRYFNTDAACQKICQLMRLPGTLNVKDQQNQIMCEILAEYDVTYTCEDLNLFLPPLTLEDEAYCTAHFNSTYAIENTKKPLDKMPIKFGKLLSENHEAKKLWLGNSKDRSKDDYRLGHIMFAGGFTQEEAKIVLRNTAKALERAPNARDSYANLIIDKVWTFELEPEKREVLSKSVADILMQGDDKLKGTSFRCHKRIDNTDCGFKLGQVLGLIAGSGVGKTSFAMNMFKWFIEQNPDYHHFFVPLEQPANEIALRWQTMCQGDTRLHRKVHILSNYDDEGNYRNLSFKEIRTYLEEWKEKTGNKIGCVVIDHIGVLKKGGKLGEAQDLMDICHQMKAFAVQLNVFLIMQSQTSRSKAGIGDLELDKDAAFGTSAFENYCDYLVTLWQPLKRMQGKNPACPTVTAFKFCKIRHKRPNKDVIKEDVPYYFFFDSDKEIMRDMTQDETKSFDYFLPQVTSERNLDIKTKMTEYRPVPWEENVTTSNSRQTVRH